MAGESGIGANGQKYSYYGCYNRKTGKGCDKENVRQDLIENAVLEKMQEIIQDDDLMDFIAENTWQYYLDHDADQEQIRIIEQQIADADKAIGNLVKSIEAGIFNDAIKARMDQLEMQKTALKKALADKELERGFKLTKDHIVYFLDQFRNLDYTDRECQKRLIDVFVNAIFLYDDEARIAFNFGGSDAVITLAEINQATAGKSFARCASYSVS
ncbi:MAG: zinc ribbon domain-containing protein, partial [Oscillospiraceae bacterium]|nr:zinc ribbon domain-containing protein [Oscillospiraceae bacterium]